MLSVRVISVLLLGAAVSVSGLKCNEGFNASLGGVPFYHYAENTCAANSNCFGQQVTFRILNLDMVMEYGGCVSSSYVNVLTCEDLFGPDSTQDPSVLLNLIPDLDGKFQLLAESFASDQAEQLAILFSKGGKGEEFMAGMIKFLENIGFHVQKLKLIQTEMSDAFTSIFTGNGATIEAAGNALVAGIGTLDTTNTDFTNALYRFLVNSKIMSSADLEQLKAIPFNNLITHLPGLVASMLNDEWSVDVWEGGKWSLTTWYPALIEMLGEVQVDNPRQTTTDIIDTFKATANFPADVAEYTDPILDSLPQLVEQLVNSNFNATYIGKWSLDMLEEFSETDATTEAMKTAIVNFFTNLGVPLDENIVKMIKYLPGLFYKVFPDNKTEIVEVYGKVATGFGYFDFSNLANTPPPTNMSIFLIDFINRVIPGTIQTPSFNATLIINFSKLFYDLLDDYTVQLDVVFTTLKTGFANYPTFDVGQIVNDLITGLGGTVPPEVSPVLVNIQSVLTAAVQQPFNSSNLFTSMTQLITAYDTAFPESKFPGIMQAYVDLTKSVVDGTAAPQDIANQYQLISIDLQFALINAMDFEDNALYEALIDAFPAYGTFIKLLKALDPADVKNLYTNFMNWIMTCSQCPPPYTGCTLCNAASLTAAMKPTIAVITGKLGDVFKDLRMLVAPNACKFHKCVQDLCNTHNAIIETPAVTKPPAPTSTGHPDGVTSTKMTTTSGSVTAPAPTSPGQPDVTSTKMTTTSGSVTAVYSPVVLNSAILLLLTKALFG